MLPKIDEKVNYEIKDQHGTLRQIPDHLRGKSKVSITRDPISRYESIYRYRWWAKLPPAGKEEILKRYPHFPNLSFSDFYEMFHIFGCQNRLSNIDTRIDLGFHTIQFIQFYFYDPASALERIDDKYIEEERFREDMAPIRFLHQETLNLELKDFLLNIGFKENEVLFIDSMDPMNTTDNQEHIALDDDVRNRIIMRDRLLYKIFPEYLPKNNSPKQDNTPTSRAPIIRV